MFTALGIYLESFEKPFLECTSEFYAAEGMKYMQQSDVPDYLKHVEVQFVFSSTTISDILCSFSPFIVFLVYWLCKSHLYSSWQNVHSQFMFTSRRYEGDAFLQIRLHEEHERCLLYLDASTRKPLVATAERQLLERHISAILDKV